MIARKAVRTLNISVMSSSLLQADELRGPIYTHYASIAYLVYMNPPPFALHMGERIAIVMTTSSGLLRSKAAMPLDEPDMWDTNCLTRSIAMTDATKWKRRAGSEATSS